MTLKYRDSCMAAILVLLFAAVLLLPAHAPAVVIMGGCDDVGDPHWDDDLGRSQYMEMTSPDSDIRITDVDIYKQGGGTLFGMAFYIGGTSGDPSGATLIYDSGQLRHDGDTTPPYNGSLYDQRFSFDPPIEIPKNTKFGFALKWWISSLQSGFWSIECLNPSLPPLGAEIYYDNSIDEPGAVWDPIGPFRTTMGSNAVPININRHRFELLVAYKPVVTSVTSPLDQGQPAVINGTGFNIDGIVRVYLTTNNDWNNPGVKITQSVQEIDNNTLNLNSVNTCGLYSDSSANGNKAYLWVEDDWGVTETGYEVIINSYHSDTTPPGPRSVSILHPGPTPHVDPESADRAYTARQFTLYGEFSDTGSVAGNCEYSLDNGATWQPASFLLTHYQFEERKYCRNRDIIATGDLDIKMRMLSCGGWGESSTLSITADDAGPESGASFTATPGSGQCSLSWAAATDNGAGMDDTNPYEIHWQEGSDPGGTADYCYGSLLYQGNETTTDHSGLISGRDYFYRLCYRDFFNNSSAYSGNPVTCSVAGINIDDGTGVSTSWVSSDSDDVALNTFTLSTNSALTNLTDLTVTGTSTSNVNIVKIYQDNGTVAGDYDAGDTFVASVPFSGNEALFSDLNISVSGTPEQYLITVDTDASATEGETLTAYILSGAGQYTVLSYDSPDTTLTIDTTAPATSDNTSSSWQNSEITVTLTSGDGSGSGVDAASGIYGCFGTGCTPAVIGSGSMTTACGSGNVCTYDVRYYSIDNAGNSESIKTGISQARVDREAPASGTLETGACVNGSAELSWSGFSDSGSGLDPVNTYKLFMATGAVPPAACSGYLRYQGTATSFTDSGLSNGQQYSYRLCAYDAAGNNTSLVASATPESCVKTVYCDSCHGLPPGFGGSDQQVWPPGGHAFHGAPCDMCHREGGDPLHVDGIITLQYDIGWNQVPEIEFPYGPIGGSCGGQVNPVGCHMGGSTNYPSMTPEWECWWDDSRMCFPPQGQ